MKINRKHFHTIWLNQDNPEVIQVIDQRKLPFVFEVMDLNTMEDVYFAIWDMVVRGAPLIGVAAAYGMYLALLNYKGNNVNSFMIESAEYLKSSRPTAVNLAYAVNGSVEAVKAGIQDDAIKTALEYANKLKENEIEFGSKIGDAGLSLIQEIYNKKKSTVNILTHCNAGWLACIDWGTATAPIYKAHLGGIPVHVWVDETRPRNQGARLTAFELGEEGIPHTVIADNTGGHLMQHGLVDVVIVGSDRTTVTGNVANKIGTYLKALAAFDNHIPFYAALPSTSIDWEIEDGIKQIPIEERNADEVSSIEGWSKNGLISVRLVPEKSKAANYGFDVTPARLITGLITERGICKADKKSILSLFPEKKKV
jgi:methylthioribose-1-phosphate isomerase